MQQDLCTPLSTTASCDRLRNRKATKVVQARERLLCILCSLQPSPLALVVVGSTPCALVTHSSSLLVSTSAMAPSLIALVVSRHALNFRNPEQLPIRLHLNLTTLQGVARADQPAKRHLFAVKVVLQPTCCCSGTALDRHQAARGALPQHVRLNDRTAWANKPGYVPHAVQHYVQVGVHKKGVYAGHGVVQPSAKCACRQAYVFWVSFAAESSPESRTTGFAQAFS